MNKAVAVMDLRTHLVTEPAEFAALSEDWNTLSERASSSCLFMSWDWHYTWWQVYSTHKDLLHIVKFTSDGQLVGILPMYIRQSSGLRTGTLMFLGTGEPREDEVATEYLDIVALQGYEDQVAESAVRWMSTCTSWKLVELRCMLQHAHLVRAYRRLANEVFFDERPDGFRYQIDLSLTQVEHFERFPPSRLKRLKRSQNAIEKDGGLKQESVASADELSKAFRELTDLNHERQDAKQRKSVFASMQFRTFHRQLCDRIFDRGQANVHLFRLGANLLAVLYCFYDDHTCYYYQSGFTKRMANRYMPLTFAHLAEIQRNRDLGRRYYDFMRAMPPTYKEDFGCDTTPIYTTYLYCTANRMKLHHTKRRIRRALVTMLSYVGVKRRA